MRETHSEDGDNELGNDKDLDVETKDDGEVETDESLASINGNLDGSTKLDEESDDDLNIDHTRLNILIDLTEPV